MVSRLILAFAMLFMTAPTTNAQEANYDEAKIPKFVLPDPLTFSNGEPVETEKDWTNKRRPEILKHFKDHVYGTMPDPPPRNKRVKFITPKQTEIEISVEPDSNETIKTRLKEVKIFLGDDPDSPVANLLIFLPVEPIAACPVFLGYNFSGNHTIHPTKENSKRHSENGTLVVRGFPLRNFGIVAAGTIPETQAFNAPLENGPFLGRPTWVNAQISTLGSLQQRGCYGGLFAPRQNEGFWCLDRHAIMRISPSTK